MGFLGGSDSKEFACNAGNPVSTPGLVNVTVICDRALIYLLIIRTIIVKQTAI